ncbi:hypothetical protein IE53DRAFT_383425 [Violaceomyces palustris]|uniref:Uncharacterized protein n=1 Tax=Violaceomyces palustris TaxID=1673888 RepID=A0ACD0P796_9BASI|nr:hypothetical protein IE53DRAFT_383425 [Violaceomyces palustris]
MRGGKKLAAGSSSNTNSTQQQQPAFALQSRSTLRKARPEGYSRHLKASNRQQQGLGDGVSVRETSGGTGGAVRMDPAGVLAKAGILRCDQIDLNEAWGKFGFKNTARPEDVAKRQDGCISPGGTRMISDGFGGLVPEASSHRVAAFPKDEEFPPLGSVSCAKRMGGKGKTGARTRGRKPNEMPCMVSITPPPEDDGSKGRRKPTEVPSLIYDQHAQGGGFEHGQRDTRSSMEEESESRPGDHPGTGVRRPMPFLQDRALSSLSSHSSTFSRSTASKSDASYSSLSLKPGMLVPTIENTSRSGSSSGGSSLDMGQPQRAIPFEEQRWEKRWNEASSWRPKAYKPQRGSFHANGSSRPGNASRDYGQLQGIGTRKTNSVCLGDSYRAQQRSVSGPPTNTTSSPISRFAHALRHGGASIGSVCRKASASPRLGGFAGKKVFGGQKQRSVSGSELGPPSSLDDSPYAICRAFALEAVEEGSDTSSTREVSRLGKEPGPTTENRKLPARKASLLDMRSARTPPRSKEASTPRGGSIPLPLSQRSYADAARHANPRFDQRAPSPAATSQSPWQQLHPRSGLPPAQGRPSPTNGPQMVPPTSSTPAQLPLRTQLRLLHPHPRPQMSGPVPPACGRVPVSSHGGFPEPARQPRPQHGLVQSPVRPFAAQGYAQHHPHSQPIPVVNRFGGQVQTPANPSHQKLGAPLSLRLPQHPSFGDQTYQARAQAQQPLSSTLPHRAVAAGIPLGHSSFQAQPMPALGLRNAQQDAPSTPGFLRQTILNQPRESLLRQMKYRTPSVTYYPSPLGPDFVPRSAAVSSDFHGSPAPLHSSGRATAESWSSVRNSNALLASRPGNDSTKLKQESRSPKEEERPNVYRVMNPDPRDSICSVAEQSEAESVVRNRNVANLLAKRQEFQKSVAPASKFHNIKSPISPKPAGDSTPKPAFQDKTSVAGDHLRKAGHHVSSSAARSRTPKKKLNQDDAGNDSDTETSDDDYGCRSDDEAGKLWRALETKLGVSLDVPISKIPTRKARAKEGSPDSIEKATPMAGGKAVPSSVSLDKLDSNGSSSSSGASVRKVASSSSISTRSLALRLPVRPPSSLVSSASVRKPATKATVSSSGRMTPLKASTTMTSTSRSASPSLKSKTDRSSLPPSLVPGSPIPTKDGGSKIPSTSKIPLPLSGSNTIKHAKATTTTSSPSKIQTFKKVGDQARPLSMVKNGSSTSQASSTCTKDSATLSCSGSKSGSGIPRVSNRIPSASVERSKFGIKIPSTGFEPGADGLRAGLGSKSAPLVQPYGSGSASLTRASSTFGRGGDKVIKSNKELIKVSRQNRIRAQALVLESRGRNQSNTSCSEGASSVDAMMKNVFTSSSSSSSFSSLSSSAGSRIPTWMGSKTNNSAKTLSKVGGSHLAAVKRGSQGSKSSSDSMNLSSGSSSSGEEFSQDSGSDTELDEENLIVAYLKEELDVGGEVVLDMTHDDDVSLLTGGEDHRGMVVRGGNKTQTRKPKLSIVSIPPPPQNLTQLALGLLRTDSVQGCNETVDFTDLEFWERSKDYISHDLCSPLSEPDLVPLHSKEKAWKDERRMALVEGVRLRYQEMQDRRNRRGKIFNQL